MNPDPNVGARARISFKHARNAASPKNGMTTTRYTAEVRLWEPLHRDMPRRFSYLRVWRLQSQSRPLATRLPTKTKPVIKFWAPHEFASPNCSKRPCKDNLVTLIRGWLGQCGVRPPAPTPQTPLVREAGVLLTHPLVRGGLRGLPFPPTWAVWGVRARQEA